MRDTLVLMLLLASAAAPLHAQRRAGPPATLSFGAAAGNSARVAGPLIPARDAGPPEGPVSRFGVPLLMGFGYGVGGALVGGRIGSGVDCVGPPRGIYQDCLLSGSVVGAVAGGSALTAFGVHAGNRFRGSLLADFAVSAAVGGAGLVVAQRTGNGTVVLAAAAAQLVAVVVTERLTSPRAAHRFTEPAPTIPAWRVNAEMKHTYASLYGLGGGLAGGFVGFVAGAYAGYRYAYPRDIARGCEDCGLGGTIVGGLIGGLTGTIGGALLGSHLGSTVDREHAVRRLQRER